MQISHRSLNGMPVSLEKKSILWILQELGCRHGNEVSWTTDVWTNLCFRGLSVFRGTLTFFMAVAARSSSSIRETALWDFHPPSTTTTSTRHISGYMSLGMDGVSYFINRCFLLRMVTNYNIKFHIIHSGIFLDKQDSPAPFWERCYSL